MKSDHNLSASCSLQHMFVTPDWMSFLHMKTFHSCQQKFVTLWETSTNEHQTWALHWTKFQTRNTFLFWCQSVRWFCDSACPATRQHSNVQWIQAETPSSFPGLKDNYKAVLGLTMFVTHTNLTAWKPQPKKNEGKTHAEKYPVMPTCQCTLQISYKMPQTRNKCSIFYGRCSQTWQSTK